MNRGTSLEQLSSIGMTRFQPNVTNPAFAGMAPIWIKVGTALTHTLFQAAALANSIALFTLPAAGIIHAVKIKQSQQFAGPAIAAYTISVGLSGTLAKYASAFNVAQAVAGDVFQMTGQLSSENHIAGTAILATAVSVGANLSVSNAGVVDIWALISVAP